VKKEGFIRRGLRSFFGFYEGANQSRNRTFMPVVLKDSHETLTPWARKSILSHSRWLCANFGIARGALKDMARYSIGSGIWPQCQTADAEWNQAAEDYWINWAKVADFQEKFTFTQMLMLISLSIDRDGDIGCILTEAPGGFPKIQLVEGHRIGDAPNVLVGKGETQDGVILDQFGRVTSYRVIQDDETTRDIPARSMILLYDPDRTDQTRGISALAHAINNLRDVKDILAFEKAGVKTNSATAMVITNKSGEADSNDWDTTLNTDTPTTGLMLEEIQGGRIQRLATGETLESHGSNRPNPTFTGFLEFIIRDVATGTGLPYEFIWNAEKLSGPAQRFIMQKANRRFQERQQLLVDRFLNRAWGYVISKAIKNGSLAKNNDWWRLRWQTPAQITVDVGREAREDRSDVEAGLRTAATHYGEQGTDWQEAYRQRVAEIAFLKREAEAQGLTLDQVQNFGNPPAAPLGGQPQPQKAAP